MDYESEQLDAYEVADAERFLIGSVKKPEPEPKFDPTLGYDKDELKSIFGGAAEEVGKRTIGGMARDSAQSFLDIGADLLTAAGEDFLEQSGFARADGSNIRLNVPAPQLPEIAEPESLIGQIARDFGQFAIVYGLSPAKLGIVGRAAVADAAFDPVKDGSLGIIQKLINAGVLTEAMQFLAVEPDEESTAQERLMGRLNQATEGAAIGAVADGLIRGLKAVKNNPKALRAFATGFISATGASISPEAAEGMPIKTLIKSLSTAETDAIRRTATKGKKTDEGLVQTVTDEALRLKNLYPEADGWLPINVNPEGTAPTFKVKDNGEVTVKWSQPAYAFHLPDAYQGSSKKPKPDEVAAHRGKLVNRTVDDVNAVLKRAQSGDAAAVEIINQANWYRSMRTRLRKEFGGMGDVFADILGATSAQTNVQQNYENALLVLRRFTRGEFDAEIAEYEKLIESGAPRDKTLYARDEDPNDPFRLIRKASGELFNTNSAAATEALLDMFRQVKKGKAPKTINFTGNLIGFGNEATIDVWAARYLRDAAGLPRIPPPAEKAVAGKHLTGSTIDNQRIGSEFGFGQEVFNEAASILNSQGGIKEFNPELGDLGPDDLQAVVWFLEKEKWAKNGWTTKAGEGGSLDYESVYGGSPDRARVAELRSIINRQGSTPEQIADARAELETLQGEPQRFTGGVSMERPGQRPTNPQQAQLASELAAPLQGDNKVIGFQANNTYGEFMGEAERALNFEVVTQVDFDPSAMTKALVEAGRKYDQDAVFVSKVVPDGTPGARPGVEVYFRDRQGVDYAQQITAILRERGIDGFTFVTDARQMDRVNVQAAGNEDVAGLVGIRFQYIPEFDDAFDASRQDEIFKDKAKAFAKVMDDVAEIDGITYADVVYYDTTVFKNTDRSGTEWINGGTSYEEHLRSAVGGDAERVGGQGDLFSEAAP